MQNLWQITFETSLPLLNGSNFHFTLKYSELKQLKSMAKFYNFCFYCERMQDLTCVFEGIDNKGAIFVSALNTAKNTALLKKHNIRAVLSIARGAYIDFVKEDIPHYLYLPADDIQSYNLSQHFDGAYGFIETARRETNVLVHCVAGISRSATITAAYLIKKYQCSLDKVLMHLKRKRSKIDPNPGFLMQLKQLEREVLFSKKGKQADNNQKNKSSLEQNKLPTTVCNLSFINNYVSPSTSPQKQPHSPLLSRKNVAEKSTKVHSNVKDETALKRKQSLNCKIDRLKRNLILEGKMLAQGQNASACISPSKVYSPLIYRKRERSELSKF